MSRDLKIISVHTISHHFDLRAAWGSFFPLFCFLKDCSVINGSACPLIVSYQVPTHCFYGWLRRRAGEGPELPKVSLQSRVLSDGQTEQATAESS